MTSLELFMILGDISPENLAGAEQLQMKPQEKHQPPVKRILMVAAMIALLALLTTACAVAYSRIRMKLVQHNPVSVTQTIPESRDTEAAEDTVAVPDVLTACYPQQLPEGYLPGDGSPTNYTTRHISYYNAEGQMIHFSISTNLEPDLVLAPPREETSLKVSRWDAELHISTKGGQMLKWHNTEDGYYGCLFTQDMTVDLQSMAESVAFGDELPLSFLCNQGKLWDVWYPQEVPEGYACTDVAPAGNGGQSLRYTSETGTSISYHVSLTTDLLSDISEPPHDSFVWEDLTVGGQSAKLMTTSGGQRMLFWKNTEQGFNAMLETTNEAIDLTAMAESVAPGEPLQVSASYLGPDYTIEFTQEPSDYVGWEPVYPQDVPEGYTVSFVSDPAYGEQQIEYQNALGERMVFTLYFRLGQWSKQFDGMGQPETVDINGKTGYLVENRLIWTDEARGFGFSLQSSGGVDLVAIAESVGPGPELTPTNADKTEQALQQLGDYQITNLPEGMVEEGLAGWPLESADDWYSYVRRWYVIRKTNRAVYFEYETYVSDCASPEEVAKLSVGYGVPSEIVTVSGCTGVMAQDGDNATVAWVLRDAAKGTMFRLYSTDFSAEELLEIAGSVQLVSGD